MSIDSQVPEETPNPIPHSESSEQEVQTQAKQETEEKQTNGPGEEEIIQEPEAKPKEPESMNAQEAALAAMGGLTIYKMGDLTKGTIVQILDDSLIIDIGTKTEGIISRDEIGIGPSPDMSGFAVGDKIHAIVINEDEEGTYHLSKRRADQMLVWEKVDESQKKGTRIQATGFRAVKGGLLVDVGTIAFLPQSLVDIRRIDDMEPMVGQKFEVRVVEYDREAQPHPKIVVSRRAVLEEDITLERDKIYDILKPGSVVDGKVIKLTNYGAFVDVGGIQGLLHISEMSLGRINHPNEVMREGDTIKVKLLKVDRKRKRISLGRRDLLPNPWETIRDKYKPGMVVEGIVVRTADFGAFVKLDDYFEGLAHISELVDNKISHAREVFNTGDKVNVYIMNIDRRNKRIKLSIRRAAEAQRKAEVDEFMKSQGDLENVFASQLQQALKQSELELPPKEEITVESEEKSKEVVAETETAAVAEQPVDDTVKPVAEVTPVEETSGTEESAEEIIVAKEATEEKIEVTVEETAKIEAPPEETVEVEKPIEEVVDAKETTEEKVEVTVEEAAELKAPLVETVEEEKPAEEKAEVQTEETSKEEKLPEENAEVQTEETSKEDKLPEENAEATTEEDVKFKVTPDSSTELTFKDDADSLDMNGTPL